MKEHLFVVFLTNNALRCSGLGILVSLLLVDLMHYCFLNFGRVVLRSRATSLCTDATAASFSGANEPEQAARLLMPVVSVCPKKPHRLSPWQVRDVPAVAEPKPRRIVPFMFFSSRLLWTGGRNCIPAHLGRECARLWVHLAKNMFCLSLHVRPQSSSRRRGLVAAWADTESSSS